MPPTSNRWKAWRASVPFITFVVALGTTTDVLVYSLVITVFPFQLERLRYHDVSSLVGWLLFIYSASLVCATPLAAMVSERFHSRRGVMIAGQCSLIVSQLLLMEAPTFWVMCIGRAFEGFSSAVVVTVGFALLCDTVPEADIGSKLGIAMIGYPLGSLMGPPIGGALYDRWGYRAPFIFGIIFTVFDMAGRILIVEKRNLPPMEQTEQTSGDADPEKEAKSTNGTTTQFEPVPSAESPASTPAPELSVFGVLWKLLRSSRTIVTLAVTFVWQAYCGKNHFARRSAKIAKKCATFVEIGKNLRYPFAFSAAEVTMPLHLQATWGLNSTKVGLVFLASILPTIISSPLAGTLSDKFGTGVIASLLLLLGIPWWGALTRTFSLAFFIVAYAIENAFIAATASPLSSELAAVTRGMDGVGYAHTYGAFNIFYGLGNSKFSRLIIWQIYGHSSIGWDLINYINLAILAVCLVLVLNFLGEKPLLQGLLRCRAVVAN
ncbi:MFS general substrate transporter [Obba rivulosa]|uniref:MFS general substrate transporter n=1 Tax=Obba rivulosa TaxID=1052685 RepID=A0A8E2DHN9_9APHY|nr:MFS general substrate transporter [Obba rivulosa]